MAKYKICKFVNGNEEEWYQVMKRGWLYWYYMYGYKGGAPEFSPCKVVSTFFTIEQAQDYIKQDISYSQKNKIKKVECFDYDPNR
jgi:hypothetical protein